MTIQIQTTELYSLRKNRIIIAMVKKIIFRAKNINLEINMIEYAQARVYSSISHAGDLESG